MKYFKISDEPVNIKKLFRFQLQLNYSKEYLLSE